MACKNTCKNAVLSERKRSDIFPPLGVPYALYTCKMLLLQRKKIEKDFEKKKWHVKIHGKMPSY